MTIATIGLNLAKSVFQAHGINEGGRQVGTETDTCNGCSLLGRLP